jgi:RNA recognition motif-containing protein
MADADATAAAIAALNESELNGRTIFVSQSVPKNEVQKKKQGKRAARSELSVFVVSTLVCLAKD